MQFRSGVMTSGFVLMGLFVSLGSARAEEFRDEVDRDFALRTVGNLQITNLRGSITVLGWAQDKIRVKARRKAVAENPEEAKRLFSFVDFRYRSLEGDIELAAEYGRGLPIQDRLQERRNPKTSMDMVVYAPANLKLKIWAMDGEVVVKNWNSPLEIRTNGGSITAENLRSQAASFSCPSCSMVVKDVKGSLRCMGGSRDVELKNAEGSSVYIETNEGSQKIENVSGEQLYVSKIGSIDGNFLKGRIEFHTASGRVELKNAAGFVSGRTQSGDIAVRMKQWKFADKALIESAQGNVSLALPGTFSGEVDLWSVNGKAKSQFTLLPTAGDRTVGPFPLQQLRGRVGDGGEHLKLFSADGDVHLLKEF